MKNRPLNTKIEFKHFKEEPVLLISPIEKRWRVKIKNETFYISLTGNKYLISTCDEGNKIFVPICDDCISAGKEPESYSTMKEVLIRLTKLNKGEEND